MTIVAGIDEAGYGPVLGPLVVAASAFRLDDGAQERDLHRLVDDKTARRVGLPVADSKRLYSSGKTLAQLELSALGHVMLARGVLPVTAAGLLADAVDLTDDELDELPWYGRALGETHMPKDVEAGEILDRAAAHVERLADRGCACVGVWVAPVPVPRFNRITAAAGTKAFTLFRTAGRLIETLVAAFPHEELLIHVDRQGGRIHYGDLLQTFFPMAPLTTIKEQPPESSYRLSFPGRAPVHVRFRVKADGSRAPVAVASAAAKLVRELFVRQLCGWFASKDETLAPTAGYGTDGQRFVTQAAAALAAHALPRELLVRCR
jgi:ribonuclease HII